MVPSPRRFALLRSILCGALLRSILCGALLLTSIGCGAGYAALFDDDSSTGPSPSLVAETGSTAPLLSRRPPAIQVVIRNYRLAATANVAVEIRAFDGTVVDTPPAGVAGEQKIGFSVSIPNIHARLTALYGSERFLVQDVPTEVAVLIDGLEVAPPMPMTLLRQSVASLKDDPQSLVIPASGAEDVITRLKPISMNWTNANDLEKLIGDNRLAATVVFGVLRDDSPEHPGQITAVRPTSDPEEVEIAFRVPRTEAPSQVHVYIGSFPSGDSSLISKVFCNPVLLGTSPATGSTDGGTTVALFGQALIPQDEAGELLFDSLRIKVRKGGRESDVPLNVIRKSLSKSTQLVFPMPPSPDGRPGPANILLGMDVPANLYFNLEEFLQETLIGAFTYGDSYPRFDPRGGPLTDRPVTIHVSPFLRNVDPVADVVSLIDGPQNLPYVSLHATRGNGMLTRFGKSVRAGNPEDSLQRRPVGVCVSGFVDGGSQTAVIINAGSGQYARHSILQGDANTNPPLRFFESLPAVEAGLACAAGRLNEDEIPDLVVVSAPSSVPTLYLSGGAPQFTKKPFTTQTTQFEFTAVEIVDLDADGNSDLVFAQAGLQPRVMIAFGNGLGQFPAQDQVEPGFDLVKAGYTLHPDAKVIGVHAVGSRLRPSLALVLSGRGGSTATPPAVAYLRRGATNRMFDDLDPSDFLTFPGGQRVFVSAVSGDLDRDEDSELIVAAQGDAAAPIRLLGFDSGSMRLIPGAVVPGVDIVDEVYSVGIGVAVGAGDHNQPNGRVGVFLAHDARIGNGVEHRVSTFLVEEGQAALRLSPPSPARKVGHDVRAVAVGQFRTKPRATEVALDAWLATPGGLFAGVNDGLGELELSATPVIEPRLVQQTLTTVAAGVESAEAIEFPAVLTEDGRLGVILPVDPTQITWAGNSAPVDLRRHAPVELRNRLVRAASIIQCGDVDSDGLLDLVVLLNLASAPDQGEEGEALLLLFPGRAGNLQTGVFPFDLPEAQFQGLATHGNASSMVIGDFAISALPGNTKELAVAVPTGSPSSPVSGNHVRFYRLEDNTFVFSPAAGPNRVLIGGREPFRVVAADYDRDGRTDLAVAYRAGRHVSVFYNFSIPVQASNPEVDLGAFVEAPANPIPFVGEVRLMQGGDLNGDSVPDLVLATETLVGNVRGQDIVFMLSPGILNPTGSGVVPPERTGNLVRVGSSWVLRDSAVTFALGDLNGDATPDLVLGWRRHPQDDFNLRVLFGNSF